MPEAIVVGGAFIMPPLPTKEDKEKMAALEKARAERVDRLLKRICETTPLGKQIVESAEKRGISIGIDGDKGNAWGSYSPSMKYVSLNEKATDAQLLSTIVHELRHSEQKPEHDFNNTVFASIAEVRAMEADAMAHECAAVFEMRSEEVGVYLDFMENNPEVFRPFVQAYNKNGSLDEAKAAAFEAFYTDETFVKTYDSRTVSFYEKGMKPGKKEVSGRELCDKIAPYMTPAFFNRDSARRLAPEIEKRLAPLTGKTSAPSVVKNRCAER